MREGVVAVVLAAGQGTRLGGPKALLLVHGEEGEPRPLVEVACRERLLHESDRAIAVLREDVAALVGERLRAAGAEVVVSTAPEELGPAGSLAAAAAHLAADALRAVVVTPVDVRVAPETVAALVAALAGSPGSEPSSAAPLAAVPRFDGRRGHPVMLAPAALARYREADPPPLRDHLRSLGDRAVAIDVPDPHVRDDLDFPHQIEALRRLTGVDRPSFLR
jgi:CTP:molybdopterin cytidylyltransferase MocA